MWKFVLISLTIYHWVGGFYLVNRMVSSEEKGSPPGHPFLLFVKLHPDKWRSHYPIEKYKEAITIRHKRNPQLTQANQTNSILNITPPPLQPEHFVQLVGIAGHVDSVLTKHIKDSFVTLSKLLSHPWHQ